MKHISSSQSYKKIYKGALIAGKTGQANSILSLPLNGTVNPPQNAGSRYLRNLKSEYNPVGQGKRPEFKVPPNQW